MAKCTKRFVKQKFLHLKRGQGAGFIGLICLIGPQVQSSSKRVYGSNGSKRVRLEANRGFKNDESENVEGNMQSAELQVLREIAVDLCRWRLPSTVQDGLNLGIRKPKLRVHRMLLTMTGLGIPT